MLQSKTVLRPLTITTFSFLTCLSFSAHAQTAANLTFDDSGTNLTGDNVQGAIEEIDTAVLGSVAHMRDLEFDPPVLNGNLNGLFWPLTAPSVTQFSEGVISTDEGGSL